MPVTSRNQESGFTMIATVLAMSLVMTLAVVAVAAVRGDTNLTARDLESKQAFEAAKAGVDDYSFHLSSNKSYWASCANVAEPSAVNQVGSTTKRRAVPGETGATYAIELLPSASQSTYAQCSTSNPTQSMLESSSSPLPGSFRIRSTGFAGKAKVSIVATFKPPSFLDFLYFTQLETSDPVTYAYGNPSAALDGANLQCNKTWQQGRYEAPIPGTDWDEDGDNNDYCSKINFAGGDKIEGPLHTNDAMAINGTPSFGRNSLDMIEVSAVSPGWYPSSSGSEPEFKGTFVTKAAVLTPPASNSTLKEIALPSYSYKGPRRICLSGATMKVTTEVSNTTCNEVASVAIPSNGVVYDASGSCPPDYSPFTATYYVEEGECGNVYISGEYSGRLTVAAENNIIITGDLKRASGSEGMLGLIANNFVRIFHNYPNEKIDPKTRAISCGKSTGEERLEDLEIDAAILAIQHSFIVDHYNCGNDLGDLTFEGAIAQKYRGAVGTGNGFSVSTGYSKKYSYDNRLRYLEPPSFIAPKEQTWVIGRETIG